MNELGDQPNPQPVTAPAAGSETRAPDHITVVYLGGKLSKVSHWLARWASPNSGHPALCGASPAFGDYWHGTGSQTEQEEAQRRPECQRCWQIERALRETEAAKAGLS